MSTAPSQPPTPTSIADYTPPPNVDPIDATSMVELLNEFTHLLVGARAVFAGCTTRLNLNALDRTFEEARRAVDDAVFELTQALDTIETDQPLATAFPPRTPDAPLEAWCTDDFATLLTPGQINYLASHASRLPDQPTTTYRHALTLTDDVPPVTTRFLLEEEARQDIADAYTRDCPRCGAPPQHDCTTTTGRQAPMHAGRLRPTS